MWATLWPVSESIVERVATLWAHPQMRTACCDTCWRGRRAWRWRSWHLCLFRFGEARNGVKLEIVTDCNWCCVLSALERMIWRFVCRMTEGCRNRNLSRTAARIGRRRRFVSSRLRSRLRELAILYCLRFRPVNASCALLKGGSVLILPVDGTKIIPSAFVEAGIHPFAAAN